MNDKRVAELYLPNITVHPGDTLAEIAERVREHAKFNGLHVITSRVVRNRYSDETVGCRITVPERQKDDALGNRIWPEGMKCRNWNSRPQENSGNLRNERYQENERYEERQRPQQYNHPRRNHYYSTQKANHYDYRAPREDYLEYDQRQYVYNSWEDRYEDRDGNDHEYTSWRQ